MKTKYINHFLNIFIALLSMVLIGCRKPEVQFTDMLPIPEATISGNTITVYLGRDNLNSSTYISPKYSIDGNTIYIFGYRTLHKQKRELIVNFPIYIESKLISIFWIDPDGRYIPIKIRKNI